MESIEDIVKRAIHDLTTSIINDGADAMRMAIYDEKENDTITYDEITLDNFLEKLSEYIHKQQPPERDYWMIDIGKAIILKRLKNILGIEIPNFQNKILEWAENFS